MSTLDEYVQDIVDGTVTVPHSAEKARQDILQRLAEDRQYRFDNYAVRTVFEELADEIVQDNLTGDIETTVGEYVESATTYTVDLIELWEAMGAPDADDTGAAPSITGLMQTAILETLGYAGVTDELEELRNDGTEFVYEYEQWASDNGRLPYMES